MYYVKVFFHMIQITFRIMQILSQGCNNKSCCDIILVLCAFSTHVIRKEKNLLNVKLKILERGQYRYQKLCPFLYVVSHPV